MALNQPMPGQIDKKQADKPIVKVLFLCCDNSCKSLIAEALLNFAGEGRFRAFSAGFTSAKRVDPIAIELMREVGIPCGGLMPKGWRGFTTANAPRIDIVVCLETNLPLNVVATLLPGTPLVISWPMENSVKAGKSRADRRSAHCHTLRHLEERVLKLINAVYAAPCDNGMVKSLSEAA